MRGEYSHLCMMHAQRQACQLKLRKMKGPATTISFLGLELDSVALSWLKHVQQLNSSGKDDDSDILLSNHPTLPPKKKEEDVKKGGN